MATRDSWTTGITPGSFEDAKRITQKGMATMMI